MNEGKLVASAALGNKELYEFLHDNPAIEFHPSNYVNDPYIISQHNRVVSMNAAKAVSLTGQVTAEALPQTHYAGVSGIGDFVRGARRSPGGKSIIMLPSNHLRRQTKPHCPGDGYGRGGGHARRCALCGHRIRRGQPVREKPSGAGHRHDQPRASRFSR